MNSRQSFVSAQLGARSSSKGIGNNNNNERQCVFIGTFRHSHFVAGVSLLAVGLLAISRYELSRGVVVVSPEGDLGRYYRMTGYD